jgi:hypothetical protein
MSKQKSRGAVWWLLMAVTVITVAGYAVAVRIGAVLEWLQWGPVPEAARTDATGTQDDERDDAPGTGTE